MYSKSLLSFSSTKVSSIKDITLPLFFVCITKLIAEALYPQICYTYALKRLIQSNFLKNLFLLKLWSPLKLRVNFKTIKEQILLIIIYATHTPENDAQVIIMIVLMEEEEKNSSSEAV